MLRDKHQELTQNVLTFASKASALRAIGEINDDAMNKIKQLYKQNESLVTAVGECNIKAIGKMNSDENSALFRGIPDTETLKRWFDE